MYKLNMVSCTYSVMCGISGEDSPYEWAFSDDLERKNRLMPYIFLIEEIEEI